GRRRTGPRRGAQSTQRRRLGGATPSGVVVPARPGNPGQREYGEPREESSARPRKCARRAGWGWPSRPSTPRRSFRAALEAHDAFERFETSHPGGGEVSFASQAALVVAVLAAFLAVATFKANEAVKDAIQSQ